MSKEESAQQRIKELEQEIIIGADLKAYLTVQAKNCPDGEVKTFLHEQTERTPGGSSAPDGKSELSKRRSLPN